MNRDALFCDGSMWYISPQEPVENEKVAFYFRTAKEDAVRIYLHRMGFVKYNMYLDREDDSFAYYKTEFVIGSETENFYFEIQDGEEICYFQKKGVVDKPADEDCFQILPGFATPDWMKGAVMYQIYTDRYCNGNPSTDVVNKEYSYVGGFTRHVTNWDKYPAKMGVREFYGGDLQGVWDHLDDLQALGVEVLYFNPLFVSPSNHKYDTQDYDYIDPHLTLIKKDGGKALGPRDYNNAHASRYKQRVANVENLEASNAFFADFVKEIHRRGMKIILDGVFNHCGSFNKWMDKEHIYEGQEGFESGAYLTKESPYHDYFVFTENEKKDWPDNWHYEGWWGFDTLPKLNYEGSKELEDYILRIGKKWVSEPYCVDGWRLDVAADLGHSQEYNHAFWGKFRKAVKEANPEAVILAEHYGNASFWLDGSQWDSVMNYNAFMEPVTWFLTGMEKHSDFFSEENLMNSDNFVGAMRHHMAEYPFNSLEVAMNQLSNHDHSRFLTRTSGLAGRVAQLGPEAANEGVRKEVMRLAVMIQMTWLGAPTLYYGDEAGVCGFTDPDNRRTYPWNHEDLELLDFHKKMISIHKENQSFRRGSVRMLSWNKGTLSYGRFTDQEQMVVIINREESPQDMEVPVWLAGVPKKCNLETVIFSDREGFSEEKNSFRVNSGVLNISMPAVSGIILKVEKTKAAEKWNSWNI